MKIGEIRKKSATLDKTRFDIKQLIKNILAGNWRFWSLRMTHGNETIFKSLFLLNRLYCFWTRNIYLNLESNFSSGFHLNRSEILRNLLVGALQILKSKNFIHRTRTICLKKCVIMCIVHSTTPQIAQNQCHLLLVAVTSQILCGSMAFLLVSPVNVVVDVWNGKKAPYFFPTTRSNTHTSTLSIKFIQRILPISRIH